MLCMLLLFLYLGVWLNSMSIDKITNKWFITDNEVINLFEEARTWWWRTIVLLQYWCLFSSVCLCIEMAAKAPHRMKDIAIHTTKAIKIITKMNSNLLAKFPFQPTPLCLCLCLCLSWTILWRYLSQEYPDSIQLQSHLIFRFELIKER
jgi:hypothetical protein